MAGHQRAARALIFMQQCRQHAKGRPRAQLQHPTRGVANNSSLNPDSFGKKMRLPPDAASPLPEWRARKQEAQPTTLASQINTSQPPAASGEMPSNPYEFPRAREIPVPRYRHNPAIKPGLWSYIKYRVFRMPEPPNPHDFTKPSFNVLTNPYRARKQWPPILSQMSETQQFHYEKKFRRRLLNKTHALRFSWDTWALFFRRFIIGFILVYFALIFDSSDPEAHLPSDGLRYWLYGQLRRGNGEEFGGGGPQFWPRRFGRWIESQHRFYMRKHKEQWDPFNHDGWDESRPRNSLPGVASPAANRPLGDPTRS